MRFKELKEFGEGDLKDKLNEIRTELMKENAQVATKTTPKSPGKIRQLKKTIARIHTIFNQKGGSKTQ